MEQTLLLLAVYAATVALHEALHYAAARMVGVEGLRPLVDLDRGIVGFTFRSAPLRGLAAALLAPQAITVVGLAVYAATGSMVALAAAAANVVGGLPDLVNAASALRLARRYSWVFVVEEGGTRRLLYAPRGG